MIKPGDRAPFLILAGYTRIMLDLSRETKYEVRRLKEDTAKGTPARIYIDISGARLALASKEPVAVEDGLLKQIRIGQYSADIVRVVLDMHSLGAHNAFIFSDPYRLVIDMQGQKALESRSAKETPARRAPAGRSRRSRKKSRDRARRSTAAFARSSWIPAMAARIPAPSASAA